MDISGREFGRHCYGVSLDNIFLQVELWSYNNFRRSWKRLAVSGLPSIARAIVPNGSEYLPSAIYDERLQRVDIFLESRTSSHILRFITEPALKFDSIYSTVNDEHILFDGDTGPSLHYCCGRLIVTGSRRDDYCQVFRIFQVLMNEGDRTFRLVQGWHSSAFRLLPTGWNSNRWTMLYRNRVVAFGNRLLLMLKNAMVFCFTPDTREAILRWPDPEPILFRGHFDNYFALCPSLNSSDVIWIVPKISDLIQEATVTPDGALTTRRILMRKSPDEEGVRSATSITKSVAASTSHIFWIQTGLRDITSKRFGLPSLEYLCLSKLCSTMEAFRRCKSEEDAIRLGIPITTWRRYCR